MTNRLFEKAADIKLRYVPFNSGGECITALLGGHVDMIWANPSEFVPNTTRNSSDLWRLPTTSDLPAARRSNVHRRGL